MPFVSERRARVLGRPLAAALLPAAVVTAGLIVTALGPASAASEAASHPRPTPTTTVHYVAPTTSSGSLRRAYHVTLVHRGSCWTTSDLNPRLYRCLLGSTILDPCWPEKGQDSVLCLGRPWSHAVTRLRLTSRLPRTSPGHGALWGLTTTSGNSCQFADGAREWFHGRSVSYYCERRWVMVGAPDRTAATWKIRMARRVHGHYEARGWHELSDAWHPRGP